jgi:hypothetical protein
VASSQIWHYPQAAAQLAVSEGIPLDVALQALQALGADVSEDRFARLYGQAEQARALVGPTGGIPPENFPPSELIQTRSTVTSTGLQYQLQVSAIDLETDRELQIPYSIVTDDMISVEEAQEAAVVAQTLRGTMPGHPSGNFRVIDARLTGVYRLVPLQEA